MCHVHIPECVRDCMQICTVVQLLQIVVMLADCVLTDDIHITVSHTTSVLVSLFVLDGN